MPELPEVETVARTLRPRLVGRTVERVQTSGLALRRPVDKRALGRALVGHPIASVERRGKYLLLSAGHHILVAHLGMTGRFAFCDAQAPLLPHTHARFLLDKNNLELRYLDPRRFGQLSVYRDRDAEQCAELSVLGCDPFADEFTVAWLGERLARSRRDLKSFLMDQGEIAGLGNIYVCEALTRIGARPDRAADSLKPAQIARLHTAILDVLREAIGNRGTSFSDYVDAEGVSGSNQEQLWVYGREGERCLMPRCAGRIQRIVQGGRSSFFCPRHQR